MAVLLRRARREAAAATAAAAAKEREVAAERALLTPRVVGALRAALQAEPTACVKIENDTDSAAN
eukprot:3632360-Pleurochrysis_carterae.AAC.1